MRKTRVGLHGVNGHQVLKQVLGNPRAELVAVSAWEGELPANVKRHATLDELLAHPDIELVSLCSPRRRDQAREAIACLEAGKHVYAEKPCAMDEESLDAILTTAKRTGRLFHEMAGTAFEQPYLAMRGIVARGEIGEVVQVFAQKSYPLWTARPLDEDVDGGLLLQVGVHAARMVEHVAGTRIVTARAVQTRLGNPRGGDLRVAAALSLGLENGALASVVANYLNPAGFPSWGNESLRLFGTKGMVEAVDGGARTRLVLAEGDRGALRIDEPSSSYFELFLDELHGVAPMPLSQEMELHPLRVLIRARRDVVDLL